MPEKIEEYEQALTNLRQALATARNRIDKMAIALTREGQTKMAETAAKGIEDLYAIGGYSREQRFEKIVQCIRRQIGIAVNGEHYWND